MADYSVVGSNTSKHAPSNGMRSFLIHIIYVQLCAIIITHAIATNLRIRNCVHLSQDA